MHASLVPMADLRAGDLIVSLDANAAPRLERVIVNQHRLQAASSLRAPLIRIETANDLFARPLFFVWP